VARPLLVHQPLPDGARGDADLPPARREVHQQHRGSDRRQDGAHLDVGHGEPLRAASGDRGVGAPQRSDRPRSFESEVRNTSELFQGQERVLQSGTDGFTVTVTRIVELVGGGTEERTITTVYVPQTRIVERGTRPRPANPPPDEDDAEDTTADAEAEES
jgi:hypothetical protein